MDTGPGSPRVDAATALAPLLQLTIGDRPPVRMEFWDGSAVGPTDGPGRVVVRSVDAVRHVMWAVGELGLARAYVAGDLDIDGDVEGVLTALSTSAPRHARLDARAVWQALRAARRLGALRPPPPRPPEEARPGGLRHSTRRDAEVISHHYDVGNDFYRLLLGPSLTYSCARFTAPQSSLEDAQSAKHEAICRKLGLAERHGARLLDVGCGWGSLLIHAATVHGATGVGVTISRPQAEEARKRVAEAGLADRVEIRLQDYRELGGEMFDAIASVGMFEHVGRAMTGRYFATLRGMLRPQGRLLNHAISSVGGSRLRRTSFFGRYVFPDGELADVGQVVLAMERAGFEVRDVESLREHYATTVRCWSRNLEAHWADAVALVGVARARIWRLYLAGSAVGFTDGGIGVHQVLGVLPDQRGGSGMPATRWGWT